MPKSDGIPQWITFLLNNLDAVDFISYIESEPAIWDSSKPEYNNSVRTEKAWKNVCMKVDAEFEYRPELEQDKLCDSLRRRWKSFRACYSREFKKRKSLKDGTAGRTPYKHYEQMRFLDSVHCFIQSSSEIGNLHEPCETQEEEKEDSNDVEEEEPNVIIQCPSHCQSKKRTFPEDMLLEVLQKKIANESSATKPSDDADSMFLSSLLPELKKIPEKHKLFVKSQIVNTILEVQTALNIASVPAPFQHNTPNSQFYPQQHLKANYETPSTSNHIVP